MQTLIRAAEASARTADTHQTPPTDDALIASAVARQLCGGISPMTMWRWVRDGVIPAPLTIRGRNYWHRSELIAAVEAASKPAPAPRRTAVPSAA